MPDENAEWVGFTRRTDDPKLAYLEQRLTEMGVPHRRNGMSWHAPIMEVPAGQLVAADAMLAERIDIGDDGKTVPLDDLPDDDALFIDSECRPHDFDGSVVIYLDGGGAR
jgi:hypothetical protein